MPLIQEVGGAKPPVSALQTHLMSLSKPNVNYKTVKNVIDRKNLGIRETSFHQPVCGWDDYHLFPLSQIQFLSLDFNYLH